MGCNRDTSLKTGDIVMISGYGESKWIYCHGWYTYNCSRNSGYYFKQIPSGKVLPEYKVDIDNITLVSSSTNDSCDCGCAQIPDAPVSKPDNCKKDRHDNRSFVTVNTIDERNALGSPYPADGRICRVNNVRGDVKYYIWRAEDLKWDSFEFPTSQETLDSIETNSNLISILEGQVNTNTTNLEWVLMEA